MKKRHALSCLDVSQFSLPFQEKWVWDAVSSFMRQKLKQITNAHFEPGKTS